MSTVIGLVYNSAQAQVKLKDSLSVPMIKLGYAFQLPGGDMAQRFGNNSNLSLDVEWKNKKNWILGIYSQFIFGSKVKEDQILAGISTSRGRIINSVGEYGAVDLFERGFNIGLKVGKVFPVIGPNPNSGLYISVGLGVLQHKIRIQNLLDDVPELSKEYKKGYDRLASGFALNEFVGYMRLDNKRRVNYFFGIDMTQGFTQNRRSYNFDTMSADTDNRIDLLSGFKFGLIIPLYPKLPDDFYYN